MAGYSWFKDTFGFEEKEQDFDGTRALFTCTQPQPERAADDSSSAAADSSSTPPASDEELWKVVGAPSPPVTLTSLVNNRTFHVGPFELPSANELNARLQAFTASSTTAPTKATFRNALGDVRTLHLLEVNAGAVFMVASQFNCLEMVGPSVKPERGITGYVSDATQGPACALSCPAGTVFRNYFANGGVDQDPTVDSGLIGPGQGGGEDRQVNTLRDVARRVVQGELGGGCINPNSSPYWRMENGYALPREGGTIGMLGKKLERDAALNSDVSGLIRVGVHWETDVWSHRKQNSPHRVCQVYASACPVAYAYGTTRGEWTPFASAVLKGAFDATLCVGAILARVKGQRQTVFLTCLGGGAFGNSHSWIAEAIDHAMRKYSAEDIDVVLVHYSGQPPEPYQNIERQWR